MSPARRSLLLCVLSLPIAEMSIAGCAHNARPETAAQIASDAGAAPIAETPQNAAPTKTDLICDQGAGGESTVPHDAAKDLSCDPREGDLDSLELAIACGAQTADARLPRTSWDHVSVPRGLDRVEQRFGLTTEERAHLMKDGVVVPVRLSYPTYAPALHDVYRSQLPIYISVDTVMHAVYRSNDTFIAALESSDLSPRLSGVLEAMHGALSAQHYSAEITHDLDLYLTVARMLLAGGQVASVTGIDKEAKALFDQASAANGMPAVNLFGRDHVIDLGAFKPRGHYAVEAAATNPDGADLSHYFQGAMWLSRLDFNLASRSSRSSSTELDSSETPREARVAMAIADLARASSSLEDIDNLDQAWGLLAGKREDVSPIALLTMMDQAKITDIGADDAPAKLIAQIGNKYVRTARTHYQAEGSQNLPVIATLLGPRITPDASATRPLVHPAVTDRHEVPMTDIAYALGHDRALAYENVQANPELKAGLDKARAIVLKKNDGPDLYSGWLNAIGALSQTPDGVVPSFMETDAFKDMRMSTAIAAYGQLRHNNVLMVPVTYDEPGCEIPEGFVEPAPATYEALIAYADRGATVTTRLSPYSASYFLSLGRTLRVLARIGDRELLNQPLTVDEQRFLSMVTEISYGRRGGYASGPMGSGWYFGMFMANDDALVEASFVADYFASVQTNTAFYAGVSEVRMGFFVVDTAGPPRVFVGPVARSFEAQGPLAERFTDTDVGNEVRMPTEDPWAASYTANPPKEPSLAVSVSTKPDKREGYSGDIVFEAQSKELLGPVTIELTDHHHVAIASLTHDVGTSKVKFIFPSRKLDDNDVVMFGVEGVHVRAGEFHYFDHGDFSHTSYMPADLSIFGKQKFGSMRPQPKIAKTVKKAAK